MRAGEDPSAVVLPFLLSAGKPALAQAPGEGEEKAAAVTEGRLVGTARRRQILKADTSGDDLSLH